MCRAGEQEHERQAGNARQQVGQGEGEKQGGKQGVNLKKDTFLAENIYAQGEPEDMPGQDKEDGLPATRRWERCTGRRTVARTLEQVQVAPKSTWPSAG